MSCHARYYSEGIEGEGFGINNITWQLFHCVGYNGELINVLIFFPEADQKGTKEEHSLNVLLFLY